MAPLVVLFNVSPRFDTTSPQFKIVLQCFSFLSVQIGNFTYKSVLDVYVNGSYKILGYSLPTCDLQLIRGVCIHNSLNKYTLQCPPRLNVFSRYFVPVSSSWK